MGAYNCPSLLGNITWCQIKNTNMSPFCTPTLFMMLLNTGWSDGLECMCANTWYEICDMIYAIVNMIGWNEMINWIWYNDYNEIKGNTMTDIRLNAITEHIAW